MQYQRVTPAAARYNLPVEWGAYVTGVNRGSPADRAGIRPGDIITRIGEPELGKNVSYVNTLFAYTAGETLTIGLTRNQQTLELQVTLGETARRGRSPLKDQRSDQQGKQRPGGVSNGGRAGDGVQRF